MAGTAADAGAEALAQLRREAEMEMRRVLDESSRPRKRPRGPAGGEDADSFVPVDRFRYAVVQELEAGAKGFIVTCNFRREKSATREASQLLRRYMPAHLFPPPPPPPPTAQGERQPMPAPEPGAEPSGPGKCDSAEAEAELGQAGRSGSGVTLGAAAGGQAGNHAKCKPAAAAADGDGGDSSSDDDEDEHGDLIPGAVGGACGGPEAADGARGEPSALGLAKVGCRGVVVMRLSAAAAAVVEPVRLVESMLADLEAGKLQPPRHCQRIIPMDATCALTETGLAAAVAAAAAAYRSRQPRADGDGDGAAVVEPFSYAITYRSRATEMPTAPPVALPAAAGATSDAGGSAGDAAAGGSRKGEGGQQRQQKQQEEAPAGGAAGEATLLDRGRIISLVASGVAGAFGEAAKVNLKKPQVAVLVETMPIAGRQFAGLALLPQHMFVAKGKLVVKPLVKNAPA